MSVYYQDQFYNVKLDFLIRVESSFPVTFISSNWSFVYFLLNKDKSMIILLLQLIAPDWNNMFKRLIFVSTEASKIMHKIRTVMSSTLHITDIGIRWKWMILSLV
jgi:hypothetical protein